MSSSKSIPGNLIHEIYFGILHPEFCAGNQVWNSALEIRFGIPPFEF
jgi:hypothetical protein